MKWTNGRTYYAKDTYRQTWHKWFAWYPVEVGTTGEGENQRTVKVWLQYIERKKTSRRASWQHRETNPTKVEFERIKTAIEKEDIK